MLQENHYSSLCSMIFSPSVSFLILCSIEFSVPSFSSSLTYGYKFVDIYGFQSELLFPVKVIIQFFYVINFLHFGTLISYISVKDKHSTIKLMLKIS